MSLKNIKYELNAHWVGIDLATGPCENCGVYRVIKNGIMEKCPNCGDDETDFSLPTVYEAE